MDFTMPCGHRKEIGYRENWFRVIRSGCNVCLMLDIQRRAHEEAEAALDRPVHRPYAPEAPIPGTHWYSGCDPDGPTVSLEGVCEGCGERACPDCGHEVLPSGRCGCNHPSGG